MSIVLLVVLGIVLVKWNQERKLRMWRDEQLDKAHRLFKTEAQKRIQEEKVVDMYTHVEWNEAMEELASKKGWRSRYCNIFKL
jgi:hypothetical protein